MLPWSQPDWLEEVTTWIDAAVERTGPIEELHRRAWSAMLRMPTAEGSVYFKASAPAHAQEAGLTEFLARRRPECTAALLAVDTGRSWMLMRDSGEMLRSVLEREPSFDRLTSGSDVVVQVEQVLRVPRALELAEPIVLRGASEGSELPGLGDVAADRVDVDAARRPRLERG